MLRFRLLRSSAIATFGILVLSFPAVAADQPILQKTFDATVDRVYATEVLAAGQTLVDEMKDACLVHFQTSEFNGGGGYRIIKWTAVCRDAGNGKTIVTLTYQERTSYITSDRKSLLKTTAAFWNNMDSYLSKDASSTSTPVQAGAGQASSGNLATCQVSSEPSGAEITLDGNYAGSTPSQLKLKPGAHSVKITKKGFEPWERSIKVEAGESRTISAELEKSN